MHARSVGPYSMITQHHLAVKLSWWPEIWGDGSLGARGLWRCPYFAGDADDQNQMILSDVAVFMSRLLKMKKFRNQ